MEFNSKEIWQEWSSLNYPPQQQFDAWSTALSDSHLKWSLSKAPDTSFSGDVKMRHLGGLRLLYCDCDICYGQRTSSEINSSDGEYFGLLYIYEGSEIVTYKDQITKLGKGSFMLWDSTKPIEFKLLSRTKKITLLVPQERLREQLPQIGQYIWKSIDFSKGLGAVTASHIATLENEANLIDKSTGYSVVDLTLELISTCLQANISRPTSKVKQDIFDQIKSFIHNNLELPGLGPGMIAEKFSISTRYLHLLFAEKGISVSHWIMDQRLEQCRRQLIHADHYRRSITNIAFQWGFNDSAHFCKVFKKKYGITPSEYQKRHFGLV